MTSVSKLGNYPLPKTDDLLADLGGGKYFTKLDMTHAYQQLELDESSKQYTTISTHQDLYRYNRLLYGVSSASRFFSDRYTSELMIFCWPGRLMLNICKGSKMFCKG